MKKFISVLLSVIMIFSIVSVGVSAADDELVISVATDLHYNHQKVNAKPGTYTGADFSHVESGGALRVESAAIIDAYLNLAANDESDFVLLAGDLTDTGSLAEHKVVAQKLADFEAATGKQVYVVPGNHDYLKKQKVDEFKNRYADFGYSEALAVDTNSASYVVDLGEEYRLIAIDSCKPGTGNSGIDTERLAWIKQQAEEAKAAGKKTIAMLHHNILKHFVFSEVLTLDLYVDEELDIAEVFAENNIKYTFTGHTHSHDIKSYTSSNGTEIYEVLTSTLNTSPCPYRIVTFGEEVKIKTRNITAIDTSCLEGVVTDYCYNLASSDFAKYSDLCLDYALDNVVKSYLTSNQIKKLLRLDAEKDAEMCAIVDKLLSSIQHVAFMPLYKADEVESGVSLESLAAEYGVKLPVTEFDTLGELVAFFYKTYILGDENHGLMSTEYTLFINAFTVALNYILSDVSADEYVAVMNFICGYFGKKVPALFINYAADGVSRAKGIDLLVSSVLCTLVLQFTTDEGTPDNNVTLPGYDEVPADESNLSFWDKFINFMLTVFDFILRFFGTGR